VREGVDLIASNACSGPVPLPPGVVIVAGSVPPIYTKGDTLYFLSPLRVLRGTRPARAGKLGGGYAFRAVREGVGLIASNACSGLIPLRCIFFGSAGPGLRAQGNSGEDGLFALCARGWVWSLPMLASAWSRCCW